MKKVAGSFFVSFIPHIDLVRSAHHKKTYRFKRRKNAAIGRVEQLQLRMRAQHRDTDGKMLRISLLVIRLPVASGDHDCEPMLCTSVTAGSQFTVPCSSPVCSASADTKRNARRCDNNINAIAPKKQRIDVLRELPRFRLRGHNVQPHARLACKIRSNAAGEDSQGAYRRIWTARFGCGGTACSVVERCASGP
jgi:hypothetical protein